MRRGLCLAVYSFVGMARTSPLLVAPASSFSTRSPSRDVAGLRFALQAV